MDLDARTLAVSGGQRARRGFWLGVLLPAVMALAAVGFGVPAFAAAGSLPAPPCATGAASDAAAFADPPKARIWHSRDLGDWRPPACFGWPPMDLNLVTALSGTFAFDGGGDELLARFGAASDWKGIRYWSASDRRWETFITDSTALEGFEHQQRRPDFTLAELKSGTDFYFLRADNRSSKPVVYRMQVAEAGPDRLVVKIGNVSPITALVFTLFDSGDIQSTYFLEKIGPGRWGYYALTVMHEGAMVIGNQDESYLTRTIAIFRHLAGIPTDQEPPLVP
ncbi:hypothetical protein FRZ44_07200 [Hypericibacter terrae]|uniref:Uncharacterized protein n=1 Tax=Hypericibacter terrae TaxID=2602015 RepID=A0A5J6ML22_9PROT|nr:DUF6675 family protein [Hypericibacter terrae]QEX15436.1 hypothetical protein FRZ44_07200 [Hypericibacter terrae]